MIERALKDCDDGVLINVDVSPNSDKNEITGFNPWRNSVVVKVKSPPKGGKANKDLLKLFKSVFECDVEIVRGEKSTQKTLLLKGLDVKTVLDKLKQLLS